MRTLSQDELIILAMHNFSSAWIEESKKLLFEVCPQTTQVPVIKDKAGKVNSMWNYRPLALASIMSKVLETILLSRLENYITTSLVSNVNMTLTCIFALKENLDQYNRQNSTVLMCFIDALALNLSSALCTAATVCGYWCSITHWNVLLVFSFNYVLYLS